MRKVIAAILVLLVALVLIGCNYSGYDFYDTPYHFNRAMISMPDGTILNVQIAKWSDAEGEQLTITAKDGTRYLVSSYNCVLIEDN
jgi:hypothetical protein